MGLESRELGAWEACADFRRTSIYKGLRNKFVAAFEDMYLQILRRTLQRVLERGFVSNYWSSWGSANC